MYLALENEFQIIVILNKVDLPGTRIGATILTLRLYVTAEILANGHLALEDELEIILVLNDGLARYAHWCYSSHRKAVYCIAMLQAAPMRHNCWPMPYLWRTSWK